MEVIKDYITEFKKHYRYSPTQLGKIERIENYITNLEQRNEKAIVFIDNYDVFKEFSFPLMKRDVEAQIKSSIDYEFKSTFRNKLKNILGGDE